MATKKTKSNKGGRGLEAAAGGLLLAAAAGYYFLYGSKKAKQNRVRVKSWVLKARADVMDQLEKLQTIGEKEFNGVIGKVSEKYKGMKNIDPKEIEALAKELKSHWKGIKRDVEKRTKGALKGKKK